MARRDPTSDEPSPLPIRKSARLNSEPHSSPPPSPQRSKVGRGRGRPKKDDVSKEQLQPVEEDPEEAENTLFATNAPAQLQTSSKPSDPSKSAAASTSHSVTARPQDLPTDVTTMLDRLADLNDDSSRILRQLAPQDITLKKVIDISNQLQKANSTRGERLKQSHVPFVASFKAFALGPNSSQPLQPDLLLTTIFNKPQDTALGQWRPDDILYKANLAGMVAQIMTLQQDSSAALATLRSWDNSFSHLSFSSISLNSSLPGSTVLVQEAFDAALALRTQLAIISYQGADDLDAVLRDLFLLPDGQLTTNAEPRMKGWGVEAFHVHNTTHLRQPFHAMAHKTYQNLHTALSNGSSPNQDPVLSWPRFQLQMVSWASIRMAELNARIAEAGGAEKISYLLKEEIEKSSAPTKPHEKQVISVSRVSRIDKQSYDLAKRAKRLSGKSRLVREPILQKPALEPINNSRNETRQNENVESASSRKGRSLIDRQPSAQRLSFDDSQPSQPESVIEVGKPFGARGTQNIDQKVNVTQDQGFRGSSSGRIAAQRSDQRRKTGDAQPIDRDVANGPIKRRRTEGVLVDGLSRTKRVRSVAEQSKIQPEASQRDELAEGPGPHDSDFQSLNGESDDENDEPAHENPRAPTPQAASWVPPATDFVATQQAAKRFASSRKQIGQKRTPWTPLETAALVDYIAAYGPRWAFIKQQDCNEQRDVDDDLVMDRHGDSILLGPNHLFMRDQVALKDKARNIKIDYLKAGRKLPPNLDKVAMKRADIEKLRHLGIDAEG